MHSHYIRKIVYVFCFGGLILHLKTAFWEGSGSIDSFSIKLFTWSMLPYLIIVVSFKKAFYGALCAAIVVFLFDLFMHLEVFVWPSSSTSALGLLFMPMWNVILFIPLSFLIGHFINKRLSK